MSFGYSVSDFVLLAQLARRTFRNCQKAGDEYVELACEVRCLYSVLRTLRTEAQRPNSKIFSQDPTSAAQLTATVNGCMDVLDKLDDILAKYKGLAIYGRASMGKKLWQRFKFGSKTEELGVARGKLITYTSTMSIIIDAMQIQAVDCVEGKIDEGFNKMSGQFERIRKEIYTMASQARTVEKNSPTLSLLSLSTYSGDEKEVWREFRRRLIRKGFRSRTLDMYGESLRAYMLKLNDSGLLDRDRDWNSGPDKPPLWLSKRTYMESYDSLQDLPSSKTGSLADKGTGIFEVGNTNNGLPSEPNHSDVQPSFKVDAPTSIANLERSFQSISRQRRPLFPDRDMSQPDPMAIASALFSSPPRKVTDSEAFPNIYSRNCHSIGDLETPNQHLRPGSRRTERRVQFDLEVPIIATPSEEIRRVKLVKSILRNPTPRFPEGLNPIREGVAPRTLARREYALGATYPLCTRHTQVTTDLVCPQVLGAFSLRYDV
jgi:hypothetical protein